MPAASNISPEGIFDDARLVPRDGAAAGWVIPDGSPDAVNTGSGLEAGGGWLVVAWWGRCRSFEAHEPRQHSQAIRQFASSADESIPSRMTRPDIGRPIE